MARCLVSGVGGFLGSHLCDELLKWGHSLFTIDNLSTGLQENIPKGIKNFYRIDLRNRQLVNFAVRTAKPEIIFHLAAFPYEGLSQFCPNLILENNLNASMNLLVAGIKTGVKRFVFTSSMSVYGKQGSPFTEDMSRNPIDIYGVTKASFENVLEIMSKVFNFEYVIVRPHNCIGPRQILNDPYRNIVGIFMNRLLQNKPFHIYGNGEQKRAFSFVGDFIPYLVKAAFIPEAANQIFNIGADKAYSINEMTKMLLEIAGKKYLKPIYVGDRKQDVDLAWCNHDKAKKILGFQDKTSLYNGLKQMWEWAKTRGSSEFRYFPYLELVNSKTPKTWTEKLI